MEAGAGDPASAPQHLSLFLSDFSGQMARPYFTLDWMSGQSGISPVDQILRNVDLADIQDERARESAAGGARLPRWCGLARWRPPVED